ncbi:MAG: uroporphyrinogen-III C-methyltransferase [Proteobacteria bacterium]|nr:uroporphyrinogen-III C-methyltransferase [Pseudomonadota bacterium]
MRHYPIFLDLRGRAVLVLGAGEAAERKAALLRAAGAEVRMEPAFDAAMLDGCALAIGAGAAEDDLRALSAAAQARGIPVNVVDRPELCSFISPAVVDRDPVTVAVSSGGAAPVLARMIRARIEAAVPPAFGRLAALAGAFKDELRRRLPDIAARRRVLERALAGRAAELVFAGREAEARDAFAAEIGEDARAEGMVFLVGAGPGAADLLTLRGQRLLGEADVIVHDRLVGDGVLDLARRDAERIYVGKARANHCLKQEEINALLVRLARAGRRVVRLKGGDPFVFGRGGEEAEALEEAGIPYEVVPGVTAALACAAQARIPLTHREASRALMLVTGHTKHGAPDIDFAAAARPGTTLAVYMGVATLPRLREGLFAAGLPRATPAVLIEAGGSAAQRELRGTLDALAEAAPGWTRGGPVLLLVGEVVGRGAGFAAAEPASEPALAG